MTPREAKTRTEREPPRGRRWPRGAAVGIEKNNQIPRCYSSVITASCSALGGNGADHGKTERERKNKMTVKEAMTKVLDDAAAFPAGWNTELKEVFRKDGKDLYERQQRRIWILMTHTPYSGEAPTVKPCRSYAKAKAMMEEDIRETLACRSPRFDEEDLNREDSDTVRLGDEITWSVLRSYLLA